MMLPIGALIWHAYNQLKWESFHRYRSYAEDLTSRIDANLGELISLEQRRSIAEFSFFAEENKQGNAVNIPSELTRSPLSVLAPVGEPAGILGYFQVDEEGGVTSPVIPDMALRGVESDNSDEKTADVLAVLDESDLLSRQRKFESLRSILIENQLIQAEESSLGPTVHIDDQSPSATKSRRENARKKEFSAQGVDQEQAMVEPEPVESGSILDSSSPVELEEDIGELVPSRQSGFDRLTNSGVPSVPKKKVVRPSVEQEVTSVVDTYSDTSRQSVSQLNLDASLEAKSQLYESKQRKTESVRRRVTLPVPSEELAEISKTSNAQSTLIVSEPDSYNGEDLVSGTSLEVELTRGDTLIQDIGPYEFTQLKSGHFILFRSVWTNGQRLVQGILLDQEELLESEFESVFNRSLIADNATMIVAYNDVVLANFGGETKFTNGSGDPQVSGSVLYRQQLTAPLGGVQLVYTVNALPPGPGARVLAGVTSALLLVLCGGFYLLYRAALKQIALAKQQQNFVSSISHELKTPLTSIRMYSEMLKSGWATPEKQQDYYAYIHNESERLTRLINNVLSLSSISHKDLRLELVDLTVDQLIDVIRSKIEGQLASSDAKIRYEIKPGLGSKKVRVDEDAFVQIMINLIDNALKFSKDSETNIIELECDQTDTNLIVFSIRDYGPGIPKTQIKKIFELFYRSENELTRETVGTGIGLAIVDQLTRQMLGSVDVVNCDPGAKFRVHLPCS